MRFISFMARYVLVSRGLRIPMHQIHMRIYEPLVAFPREQRQAWTQYVAAHPPENEQLVAQLYEEIVRANSVDNGPRLPGERTPQAYIARHDGQIMICPVQLRFRSIRAAESRPDLFSPTGLAHGAAAALLASLRTERRGASDADTRWDTEDGKIRARTASWAAPISWLMMFRPEDRFNAAPERLCLRAGVREVLARLKVVREELEAMRGGIAPDRSEVADLIAWLTDFHPKGVVEMDYGGTTVPLLANGILSRDADGFAYDAGVGDLLQAREYARLGDVKAAIAAYRGVYQRIRRAKFLATAS